MSEFLLLYRLPEGHVNDDADVSAWNEWLTALGDDLLDLGRPITETSLIGDEQSALRLTGFSTIAAADLRAAEQIARRCPAVASGGTVEIGAVVAMPEGHGPR
jgi:hypothetical protein